MKPLMGQVQNQAHLDDLIGSPKVKGGNFSRPGQNVSPSSEKNSPAPSFSDMLLSTINKKTQQDQKKPDLKAINNRDMTPKIPDEPRRVDRPVPKSMAPEKDPRPTAKANNTPDAMPGVPRELSRTDIPETDKLSQTPSQSIVEQTSGDAKAALAPLKKQVSGKAGSESLLNGNAVLAFVAGRLDKLDPDTLPSVISGSTLIKQAMSSGDIAEFMQTPMTIADLANMMELDQGLLNRAAANGLDPSRLVSPRDFVNALGIDAGRVTAELTMLQQKLPVDGIKSYIERAKALASKAVASQDAADSLSPQKQNSDTRDSMPGIKPATSLPDGISSAIEIPVPIELSGQVVAGPMAAMNAPSQASANLNFSNKFAASSKSTGIPLETPSKPAISEDPAEILIRQARASGQSIIKQDITVRPELLSELAMPLDITKDQSGTGLKNDFDSSKLPLIGDENSLLYGKFPDLSLELNTSGANITKDPFAAIGQMMDSNSKININFGGDGLTQRSLQEHLLANGLDAGSYKNAPLTDSTSIVSDRVIKPTEGQSGLDYLTDFKLDVGLNVARENLNAATQATTIAGSSSFTESDRGEQDTSQDFSGQFSDHAGDIASAMAKGATNTREAEGVFSDKLANAPKTHNASPIAAKILGHAQMMLKNGGGTMSVNVEAPGIGKVDVAINLINNQLDIRIITASDQARDMISREITGLRDGLTQQGINLRGLEVGKAGETPSRHFSGQGQQQFGQGAQDQRATYNDMKEYVQSFKNTYNPRATSEVTSSVPASTRWMNKENSLIGGRRLEIRV